MYGANARQQLGNNFRRHARTYADVLTIGAVVTALTPKESLMPGTLAVTRNRRAKPGSLCARGPLDFVQVFSLLTEPSTRVISTDREKSWRRRADYRQGPPFEQRTGDAHQIQKGHVASRQPSTQTVARHLTHSQCSPRIRVKSGRNSAAFQHFHHRSTLFE